MVYGSLSMMIRFKIQEQKRQNRCHVKEGRAISWFEGKPFREFHGKRLDSPRRKEIPVASAKEEWQKYKKNQKGK